MKTHKQAVEAVFKFVVGNEHLKHLAKQFAAVDQSNLGAVRAALMGVRAACYMNNDGGFATAFTILIVAPFHFLQAAFNEAERGLAGLGLLGPWAWGIIAVGFFFFAYFVVLIIRAMIGALIPGELEEAE